jgi:enoyl-CoA hydratase/carnithine racemase
MGAIVLTGAGKPFCADGDLDRFAQRPTTAPVEHCAGVERLHISERNWNSNPRTRWSLSPFTDTQTGQLFT